MSIQSSFAPIRALSPNILGGSQQILREVDQKDPMLLLQINKGLSFPLMSKSNRSKGSSKRHSSSSSRQTSSDVLESFSQEDEVSSQVSGVGGRNNRKDNTSCRSFRTIKVEHLSPPSSRPNEYDLSSKQQHSSRKRQQLANQKRTRAKSTPDDLDEVKSCNQTAARSAARSRGQQAYAAQQAKGGGGSMVEFNAFSELSTQQQLLDTRARLAEAQSQLHKAKKRSEHVLSNYYREESYRSMNHKILSLPQNEQAELIKLQVESRFFDATSGLEPHVVNILNQKLAQIRDYFVGQIQLISHHADNLRQKVALMESENRKGLKFEDLDTERLMEQLSKVEELKRNQNMNLRKLDKYARNKPEMDRARVIWGLFTMYFGLDYFNEVIEQEYGIAPKAFTEFQEQITRHFEYDIEALKSEHQEVEKHYKEQVGALQNEIQSLVRDNTHLVHRADRAEEQSKQEHQRYAKILVENAKQAIEKRYKNSLKQAYLRVAEMSDWLKNQSHSHKLMQLNYGMKRWLMFVKMTSLIKKVERENKTEIDNRMLELAKKFLREDFLIISYSKGNGVPDLLAREEINAERIGQLKSKVYELQRKNTESSYRISEQDQSIQEYQCEIEKLKTQLTEFKLRLPALETQKQLLEDALDKKEQECRSLEEQVRTIENRWRSNAREPHKVTAKGILAALKLKSLNERATHTVRKLRSVSLYKRSSVHQETITEICGLKYRIMERISYNNKHTSTKTMETREACVGDFDYRREEKSCSNAPELQSVETQTLSKRLIDINFVKMDQEKTVAASNVRKSMSKGQVLRKSMVKSQTTYLGPSSRPALTTVLSTQQFTFPIASGNATHKNKAKNEETRSQASAQNSASKQPTLMRRNTLTSQNIDAMNQTTRRSNGSQSDKQEIVAMRRTFAGGKASENSPAKNSNRVRNQVNDSRESSVAPVQAAMPKSGQRQSELMQHSKSVIGPTELRQQTQKLAVKTKSVIQKSPRPPRSPAKQSLSPQNSKQHQGVTANLSNQKPESKQAPPPMHLSRKRKDMISQLPPSIAGMGSKVNSHVATANLMPHMKMQKFKSKLETANRGLLGKAESQQQFGSKKSQSGQHSQQWQKSSSQQTRKGMDQSSRDNLSFSKVVSQNNQLLGRPNVAAGQTQRVSSRDRRKNLIVDCGFSSKVAAESVKSRSVSLVGEQEKQSECSKTDDEQQQVVHVCGPQILLNSQTAGFTDEPATNSIDTQTKSNYAMTLQHQLRYQMKLQLGSGSPVRHFDEKQIHDAPLILTYDQDAVPNELLSVQNKQGSPVRVDQDDSQDVSLRVQIAPQSDLKPTEGCKLDISQPCAQSSASFKGSEGDNFVHFERNQNESEVPLRWQLQAASTEGNDNIKLEPPLLPNDSLKNDSSQSLGEIGKHLRSGTKLQNQSSRRLTLVKEQEGEFANQSSHFSSSDKRQRNTQQQLTKSSFERCSPDRHDGLVAHSKSQFKNLNSKNDRKRQSTGRLTKLKHSRKKRGQEETFNTSEDSDSEYNRRSKQLLQSGISRRSKTIQSVAKSGSRAKLINKKPNSGRKIGIELQKLDKERNESSNQSLISAQKLLMKGFITEEQFVCLKLLDKGFVPAGANELSHRVKSVEIPQSVSSSSQEAATSSNQSRKRSSRVQFQQALQATLAIAANQKVELAKNQAVSSGKHSQRSRLLSSESQTPRQSRQSRSQRRPKSKRHSVDNYKLNLNNVRALEQVLNRKYATKRSMGVQCDPMLLSLLSVEDQKTLEVETLVQENQLPQVTEDGSQNSESDAPQKQVKRHGQKLHMIRLDQGQKGASRHPHMSSSRSKLSSLLQHPLTTTNQPKKTTGRDMLQIEGVRQKTMTPCNQAELQTNFPSVHRRSVDNLLSEKQVKRQRILSGSGQVAPSSRFFARSEVEQPYEQARLAQKANIQTLVRLRQSKHKVLKLNKKQVKTRNTVLCPTSQARTSASNRQLRPLYTPPERFNPLNFDGMLRPHNLIVAGGAAASQSIISNAQQDTGRYTTQSASQHPRHFYTSNKLD